MFLNGAVYSAWDWSKRFTFYPLESSVEHHLDFYKKRWPPLQLTWTKIIRAQMSYTRRSDQEQ